MRLPTNHPLRIELNDEVHARPPEALTPPSLISFLALTVDEEGRAKSGRQVAELAKRFGIRPPLPYENHFSADFGPFRLKWERHTEYIRYKVIVEQATVADFNQPAIARLPEDWLSGLVGQVLVASNVVLVHPRSVPLDVEAISHDFFGGNGIVGSVVAGGNARAFTDFCIHEDGFSRILVQDMTMTPRQAGRVVQNLLEIDTYRMLALLAFPAARKLAPFLGQCEQELVKITGAMVDAGEMREPQLLDRLMRLEAAIESKNTENLYRFSAARAYYELVQRRISELREDRIEGLQPFQEFMERRLGPAMSTCSSTAARLQALSARVSQATQLLSTKVDVVREEQNQVVLTSMNRRAKLQLRLQQTVEGLSIAAVTYYIVGLVGYAAKAVKAAGLPLNPDFAIGLSIPLVAGFVAYGVHRVRATVTSEAH